MCEHRCRCACRDSGDIDAGTVGIAARSIAARRIGARVVDARIVDARIVDARIVDARIVDARIVDARIVDARVVDARVVGARVGGARVGGARVGGARCVGARSRVRAGGEPGPAGARGAAQATVTMAQLRRSYDLLLMKVLSLIQDTDRKLARSIIESREALWDLLADPARFSTLRG